MSSNPSTPITHNYGKAICINNGSLTINDVNVTAVGSIYAYTDISITNSNVTVESFNDNSPLQCHSNMKIEDSTIVSTVNNQRVGDSDDNSRAVLVGKAMTIKNSDVTATGGAYGVSVAEALIIEKSRLTANGHTWNGINGKSVSIKGGTIDATGKRYGIAANNGVIDIQESDITAKAQVIAAVYATRQNNTNPAIILGDSLAIEEAGKLGTTEFPDAYGYTTTSFIDMDDEYLEKDASYVPTNVLSNVTVYITADYSAVDEAIAKIPSDLSIFTDASVKALNDAKNAVERGKNITEQDTVDGYATAIENAIEKLVLKGEEDTTLMKSILKSAIDKAIAAEASTEFKTLAPSVKALIIATRNAAELVYNDANATNAQCLEAWMNVADALHFLDFQANKATLLSLITVCNDINTDEYDIGVEAFIAALDNAKTVYANAHALQKSINAAQTRLEDARNGLAKNPTNVNKSVLEYTISTIEGKVGNGDKYKQDASWTAYRKALIDAKAVMANAEATQAEVDTSLYALTSAYENIRLLPSEEQLAELNGFIAVVNGLNRNNYSAAQWKVIDETAVKAQAMINDFDETKFPMLQREMADALGVINEVTTPKSENQGMNGSPDSANPNTGDRTNVTGIFFALFLSGCGIFMIKKKRNRNTQA